MLPTTTTRRSNFPTRPERTVATNCIPEDIISSGRNLRTEIQFVQYSFAYQNLGAGSSNFLDALGVTSNFLSGFNILPSFVTSTLNSITAGARGVARPQGGMILPIPKRINESQVLSWEEESATRTAASIAAGSGAAAARQNFGGQAANFGSALLGFTVNPYLFMYFQKPSYKEFSFNWTFAPRNRRESEALANIINSFKANSLPSFDLVTMSYPNIALIRMHPSDLLGNLKFKPCAITSVLVDYTGAGPSFFKDENGVSSGAPTVVNLTVNFKEIQLWDRREITR